MAALWAGGEGSGAACTTLWAICSKSSRPSAPSSTKIVLVSESVQASVPICSSSALPLMVMVTPPTEMEEPLCSTGSPLTVVVAESGASNASSAAQ